MLLWSIHTTEMAAAPIRFAMAEDNVVILSTNHVWAVCTNESSLQARKRLTGLHKTDHRAHHRLERPGVRNLVISPAAP